MSQLIIATILSIFLADILHIVFLIPITLIILIAIYKDLSLAKDEVKS